VEARGEEEQIVGCTALELVWRDLAEVKSLAVDDGMRRRGIGSLLVQAAVEEARALNLSRVFALTRDQPFFAKQGFQVVDKDTLPHKVWTDCVRCPLQEHCDEIAVVINLTPSAATPQEPASATAGV
jgi:amino-acid N-acetyltransferase